MSNLNKKKNLKSIQTHFLKFKFKNNRISGSGQLDVVTKLPKKCLFCGIVYPIEVHHIIPKKKGGTNKDENLLFVCPNHHKILHDKLEVMFLVENKVVVYNKGKINISKFKENEWYSKYLKLNCFLISQNSLEKYIYTHPKFSY